MQFHHLLLRDDGEEFAEDAPILQRVLGEGDDLSFGLYVKSCTQLLQPVKIGETIELSKEGECLTEQMFLVIGQLLLEDGERAIRIAMTVLLDGFARVFLAWGINLVVLDISTERKDSAMILKNLMMCATAHADMDQMDSAYYYIKKGIELEKHANMDQLSDIYSMMAEIYAEQGQTAKAQAYLNKWKQTDSNNTKWYLIPAYIRKAQGEYDMAIRLAELGLSSSDQNVRRKSLELLTELYDLKGERKKAEETRLLLGSYDDMKYTNQALMMVDWQKSIDEQRLTKDFYLQTTWMQRLVIVIVLVVVLVVVVGMWWHRRKVRRLSNQLDEDARNTSELNTKVGFLEKRMEHISNALLIGTKMYSQLQQRQCIAEATAKEQQSLVDYFAQLRPKRWQEWKCKYKNLSTAQYVFLILQDDLHYDDETIASIFAVKRTSVRSMRSRIKSREKVR